MTLTQEEKFFLMCKLDEIFELLDKVPNREIEFSTESKVLQILEKINDEFELIVRRKI